MSKPVYFNNFNISRNLINVLRLLLLLVSPSLQASNDYVPNTDNFDNRYYGSDLSVRERSVRENKVELIDTDGSTVLNTFTTIQECADVIQPGQTCLVYADTYDERVNTVTSGTPGNIITFISETPRAALMQGFIIAQDYIRIEGFDISTDLEGWGGGGIWIAGHNLEIVNNYFHDIPYTAIVSNWTFYSEDLYAANNYIYHCNKGMDILAHGALIENNEIERLVRYGYDADYFRLFGNNIVVRGNYMHGTLESEIGGSHVDGFQTFSTNGDTIQHLIIENNILTDFYHQGMMFSASTYPYQSYDITVRNNVFDSARSWGVLFQAFDDVKIYNNVFSNYSIHAIGIRDGTTNARVYNNIIDSDSRSVLVTDSAEVVEWGYNLISNPDPIGGGGPTDTIGVDPQFIDASNAVGADGIPWTGDDGFNLLSTSPAIDNGTNAAGIVDFDILGTLRPQGNGWDIGAYEYQDSSGINDNNLDKYFLYQNYPNPFNSSTVISYHLAGPVHVALQIYDVMGRLVRTLFNEHQNAGEHNVTWDCRDKDGNQAKAGVYIFKISAGDFNQAKKMVLFR